MLNSQYFKDSESDRMAPRVKKRQCLDKCNNKDGQSLDGYKGEGKGEKYVFFPFIAFFSSLKKV